MSDWLKRSWIWIVAAVLLLATVGVGVWGSLRDAMQKPSFWESAIADFEEQDHASPPEPGMILFTGSSSIRMWSSLAEDMQPLRVLNRGFGGSHIDHVNHFAPRIVLPYRPSAVVLYAGDNDLSEGTGKTPESVTADFERFVGIVHGAWPEVPVYFLSIKPSILRWDRWPEMRDANARIRAFAEATDAVEYVDVATPMLGERGTPRGELFSFDGLHLNTEGYALWASILKPVLLARHGR